MPARAPAASISAPATRACTAASRRSSSATTRAAGLPGAMGDEENTGGDQDVRNRDGAQSPGRLSAACYPLRVLTPETEAAGEDAERRVVLHGISWAAYLAIGKALGETTSIRLAYLRGALEIMSPSDLHEARKTSIHNLLFAYAQE